MSHRTLVVVTIAKIPIFGAARLRGLMDLYMLGGVRVVPLILLSEPNRVLVMVSGFQAGVVFQRG